MDPDVALNLQTPQKDKTSLYESCKRCPKTAHCCYRATTIVVLPHEAETLIERTGSPELLKKEANGLFTIVKAPGEPCPFLTAEGLCGVYQIRPIDCRSWPLTLGRPSDKTEYVIDADCTAARQDELSQELLAAAKHALDRVPPPFRPHFIQLVHRDSLPLVPLTPNGNGGINK